MAQRERLYLGCFDYHQLAGEMVAAEGSFQLVTRAASAEQAAGIFATKLRALVNESEVFDGGELVYMLGIVEFPAKMDGCAAVNLMHAKGAPRPTVGALTLEGAEALGFTGYGTAPRADEPSGEGPFAVLPARKPTTSRAAKKTKKKAAPSSKTKKTAKTKTTSKKR